MRLDFADGVPAGNIKTLGAIVSAMELAGAQCLGTPEQGSGAGCK